MEYFFLVMVPFLTIGAVIESTGEVLRTVGFAVAIAIVVSAVIAAFVRKRKRPNALD